MPAHAYYIELSHDEQNYLTSLIKTRTLQVQVVTGQESYFGNLNPAR